MSTSHRTVCQRFDFANASKSTLPLRIQDAGITSSLENGALKFDVSGVGGNSVVDLGVNGIPKADLMTFECVMKCSAFDEQLDIRAGVASGFNVDPDVIPEVALFKLKGKAGAANANDVFIETRDSVRDLKGTATQKEVPIDQWTKWRIDFATGIQSIGAPGLSKGGWGSVRFMANRLSAGNAFAEHIMPSEATKHMDMDDAAGPFQPYVQVRLLAAPTAGLFVYLKEITLEYRVF